MAERFEAFRRFDYRLNSNLVIQKESHGPTQIESTGEPESLVGRLVHRMGDKALRTTAKELRETAQKKRAAIGSAGGQNLSTKKLKRDIRRGPGILEAEIAEVKTYHPSTSETTLLYEQLLSETVGYLGDQPEEVLTDAAEEVVHICRHPELKETQKQISCEELLGKLTSEQFTKLYQICRSLHDFALETAAPAADAESGTSGVAVVFDEEDEEEEDVRLDEEDEEDEEDEDTENREETPVLVARQGDNDDEEIFNEDSSTTLNVRAIGAHWLQRELSKFFPDAEMAVEMEKKIIDALPTPDLQECENKLVYILKYDNFNFAKLLLNNRWRVLYCTLLGQAQGAEEKDSILEQMAKTPQGQEVLEELQTVKLRVNKEREFARNVRKEAAVLAGRVVPNDEDNNNIIDNSSSNQMMMTDNVGGTESTFDTRRVKKKESAAAAVAAGSSSTTKTLDSEEAEAGLKPSTQLDLEAMAFQQGGNLMANSTVKLRENTQRIEKKEYDEITIFPVQPPSEEDEGMDGKKNRLPITELPEWAQPAFTSAHIQKLNLIQTKVMPVAFEQQDKNMLICAPTGAGKTNIAVLAILCLLSKHRSDHTGIVDKRGFKVVYISPMKALVAEQVAAFQKRFSSYGLRVEELTGDVNLTRQQIEDTQIIVTTPEKWDVITRKSGDRAYTQLVKLVIIDEVHLLHDSRGPVLEALVARTLRQVESTQEHVRIVGLSATLPNYHDVAIFLRVSLAEGEGLFVFGSHYRPVPLTQTYIGLKEKKATKRLASMNKATYEKVLEEAGKNQVLVFVHSRKEAVRTARIIRQMAMDDDTLARFLQEDSASREILQTEADAMKTQDLKDLLPFGFAVHHAGLPRTDRRLVEDLFADRHIQVLVSTATLAWGVNLPAHTVIIKGTQVYLPEKGRWSELSPLDVMQMLGRAGRPQYDTTGHGIIITSHSELQFYLSLNNQQLPIESQMLSMLPDLMNAEINLGTFNSRKDAVQWLGYTYLYVRLLRNPTLYGLPEDVRNGDEALEQVRTDIAHSALLTLDRLQLIRYERRTGQIQPTPLGRVASHFYVRCPSIAVYNEHLRPSFSDIELLRLFSLSHEFRYIPVREEEKVELAKLIERVPIPVKGGSSTGSVDETSTKVNVLLQAYISQLKLEGFALSSDMSYIQQSAGRIMRALFDISLKRGWAQLARRALLYCKMISARTWSMMSPLRQFKGALADDVLRKLEKKDFPWERYFDLSAAELGELVRMPKLGKTLHRLVHAIPKVDLAAYVQPLTRSTLLVEVSITPDFRWDSKYHDAGGESFWIIVEDGDGERVLHHELILLKEHQVSQENSEVVVDFAVPITEPLPPNYFLSCISDKWLQSEATLPISFKNLILPEKNPPQSELLDLQPLPIPALKFPEAEAIYTASGTRVFGPIETQTLSALYNSDDNVLVCAPPRPDGLTTCAEFAILRMVKKESLQRAVYIVPYESCVRAKAAEWQYRFGKLLNLKVAVLKGDIVNDMKLITESNLIISCPEHWDFVSRRWRTRRVLQQISLFIVDELELLDSSVGATMEVCLSRMRYVSAQLPRPIRFVGLSVPLANASDAAGWLGVEPSEGYDIHHRPSRLLAMARPTYQWIKRCCRDSRSALIFCSDRKQCRVTAVTLLFQAAADDNPKMFLHMSDEAITKNVACLSEKSLQNTLSYGVGYLHEGLSQETVDIVTRLYETGAIQVLVLTEPLAWSFKPSGHLVIVQDTNKYDVRSKRWINYPIVEIMRMMGRAGSLQQESQIPSAFLIMCPQSRRNFYNKFKSEPLPVESSLDQSLADHLNAEVALKTIESKQDAVDWMTWSLYYRRLTKNPNYYGLQGITPVHLSEHLSDVVEAAVDALATAQCLEVDPTDQTSLSTLNLGLVAAFYYIKSTTIDLMNRSATATIKRKGLIEILCSANEFGDVIPIRFGEETILKKLAYEMNLATTSDFNEPNIKTSVLLHAHFHRTSLTLDLSYDQKKVLELCIRLLHAGVDVISSNGWLRPALISMEICQMIVQALQQHDSPLLQLPNFDNARVQLASSKGVTDIFDLINADEERDAILEGLTSSQIEQIAEVCNRYPVINVEFDIPSATKPEKTDNDIIKKEDENSTALYIVQAGTQVAMVVTLQRVADTEDISPVTAPFYPQEKFEQWWIVIGRSSTNTLFAIKRTAINRLQSKITLDFDVPKEPGIYNLVMNLMCDSYIGCDQEYDFSIKVN